MGKSQSPPSLINSFENFNNYKLNNDKTFNFFTCFCLVSWPTWKLRLADDLRRVYVEQLRSKSLVQWYMHGGKWFDRLL